MDCMLRYNWSKQWAGDCHYFTLKICSLLGPELNGFTSSPPGSPISSPTHQICRKLGQPSLCQKPSPCQKPLPKCQKPIQVCCYLLLPLLKSFKPFNPFKCFKPYWKWTRGLIVYTLVQARSKSKYWSRPTQNLEEVNIGKYWFVRRRRSSFRSSLPCPCCWDFVPCPIQFLFPV